MYTHACERKVLSTALIFLISVLLLPHTVSYAAGSKVQSIGGGGGPFIMWKMTSSPELDRLAVAFGVPNIGASLMGVGGGGFAIFKNARIGGLGAGTSVSSTDLVGGVENTMRVEFGYGGFLAEYLARYKRATFSVGCLLGGGGYTVKLKEGNSETKSEKGFFCLEPCVGAGIRLVHFVSLQGWAGYLFAPTEEMAINYNGEIYRFKPSEMGGFNFRLMLVFGSEEY